MNFTYETQGAITYLVCELDPAEQVDTLTLGMLTNNHIPGLAPVLYTEMNGQRFLKYNISAKLTAGQFFSATMNKQRTLIAFQNILNAICSADEYMIEPNCFNLEVQHVYLNVSSCETAMVCIPVVNNKNVHQTAATFFKQIMENTQFDANEDKNYVLQLNTYLDNEAEFSIYKMKEIVSNLLIGAPTGIVVPAPAPQPVVPAAPVMPVTPVAPVAPEIPAEPAAPVVAETPDEPVVAETPAEPVVPATPVVPVAPASSFDSTISIDDMPAMMAQKKMEKEQAPEIPAAPAAPAPQPVIPAAPAAPAPQPVIPAAPAAPAPQPVIPAAPVAPAPQPVIPAAPAAPAPQPVIPAARPMQPAIPVPPTPAPAVAIPPAGRPMNSGMPMNNAPQPAIKPAQPPAAPPAPAMTKPPVSNGPGFAIPGQPAGVAKPSAPAPAVPVPGAPAPAVPTQPSKGEAGEKKMSFFGLLSHYNKENAEIYKKQKEEAKAKKAAAVPTQPPMPAAPAGAANPSVPMPVAPNGAPAGAPAQPSFAAPQYHPPVQPVPVQNSFNETTVLSPSMLSGETTVLGVNPSQPDPCLIRSKTGERIHINKPVFRIGKEKSYVDFFIADNTAISRSHANIHTENGEYFIEDTNSTNHTYINGNLIVSNVKTKLSAGDKVRLANEDFTFTV